MIKVRRFALIIDFKKGMKMVTKKAPSYNKQLLKEVIKKIEACEEKVVLKLLKENPVVFKHLAKEYKGCLSKKDSRNFKANALMIALENNLSLLAKQLLRAGAPVNFKDEAGRTALMIASQRANHPLVKLLLEKGAQVNAVDSDGLPALIYAIGGESDRKAVLPVVKTLLAKGADPNLKEANALAYANYDWENTTHIDKNKIIDVLIKYGAHDDEPDIIDLDEFILEFKPE